MKDLEQYHTPETDDFYCNPPENEAAYQFARDLERRLAACRDALEEIAESESTPMSLRVTTPSTTVARTLKLTKPQ